MHRAMLDAFQDNVLQLGSIDDACGKAFLGDLVKELDRNDDHCSSPEYRAALDELCKKIFNKANKPLDDSAGQSKNK